MDPCQFNGWKITRERGGQSAVWRWKHRKDCLRCCAEASTDSEVEYWYEPYCAIQYLTELSWVGSVAWDTTVKFRRRGWVEKIRLNIAFEYIRRSTRNTARGLKQWGQLRCAIECSSSADTIASALRTYSTDWAFVGSSRSIVALTLIGTTSQSRSSCQGRCESEEIKCKGGCSQQP